MAMGQQKNRQGDLMVGWSEMPRSPGHVFYDRLQSVLVEANIDAFCRGGLQTLLRGGSTQYRRAFDVTLGISVQPTLEDFGFSTQARMTVPG